MSRGAPDEAVRLGPDRIAASLSILAGSLATTVPLVATVPVLPPFGLLMLLAWRLRRPGLFPSWAAVPFGLFDDTLSGQPFGAAMALWTAALVTIDIADSRLVWRDFWQDWTIAAVAVAAFLGACRLVTTPLGAHVDTVLLLQIASAVALYPLVARLTARIDGRRRRRFA